MVIGAGMHCSCHYILDVGVKRCLTDCHALLTFTILPNIIVLQNMVGCKLSKVIDSLQMIKAHKRFI